MPQKRPPAAKRWLHFDAEEQPLRIPSNFRGTREEFASLVHALEPHHCSYPTGSPIDSQTGKPCRRCGEGSGKYCIEHSSADVLSALFARNINHGLANRIRSANSAADKWSLDAEISFVLARLSILVEQLNTGESGHLWRTLQDKCERSQALKNDFVKAKQAGDNAAMGAALQGMFTVMQDIAEIVTEGENDRNQWDEICEMLDRSVNYKAADAKNHRDRNLMISAEHAISMYLQLAEQAREAIPTQAGRIEFAQWVAEKLKVFGPTVNRQHVAAIERAQREANNAAMNAGDMAIDSGAVSALSSLEEQIEKGRRSDKSDE
ncbi:hypothetical protein [Kordiimonas sp.]|uniref:hypothetical protein n=1 Tax=Kordiimonas sp. TaxID=1970157 RepID=UPI003A8FCC49